MNIDYNNFSPGGDYSFQGDYPSNDKIGEILLLWQKKHPEKIKYFEVGRTVKNRIIHGAELSDFTIEDDNKSHIVFAGAEHGTERNATLTIIKLAEWLLSSDLEAVMIMRTQRIVIVPAVNADGYESLSFTNVNSVNIFADYQLDGSLPEQPESRALAMLLQQYMPELFISVHGHSHDEKKVRLIESTGIAYTTRVTRCYSRKLVERINCAAEQAGYFQDRGEEDDQRILAELPDCPQHSFGAFDRGTCTSATYAYHNFHSLAMSMEIVFVESGFLRLKESLRCGLVRWTPEDSIGYPAWVISRWGNTYIAPGGRTLAERRRNRVIMWKYNIQNTVIGTAPEIFGTFFGGVGLGYSVMRQLHELSSAPYRTPPEFKDFIDLCEKHGLKTPEFQPGELKMLSEAELHYQIEPCALNTRSDPDGELPSSIKFIYRLPADTVVQKCLINGENHDDYVIYADNCCSFFSTTIPVNPEFPVNMIFLNY